MSFATFTILRGRVRRLMPVRLRNWLQSAQSADEHAGDWPASDCWPSPIVTANGEARVHGTHHAARAVPSSATKAPENIRGGRA